MSATNSGSPAASKGNAAPVSDKVASLGSFGSQSVIRLSSNDAAELAASIPGWDVELTQLQPGPFAGRVTLISLGPVLISSGQLDQPMLLRFSAPRGCVTVNRPGRGSSPSRYLGHEVQADECFVGGSNAEVEGVTGSVLFPSALSMRIDAWHAAQPWLGASKLPFIRGAHLRRAGMPWTSAFHDAMEWIVEAVAQYPEALDRTDVRESLADTLLARVNMLDVGEFPVTANRQARVQRRVAVERAREYIHTNLAEPIRLSHLCQYARTEARALEYGFRDMVGLSPMAYVRTTRLHRARGILRSAVVLRSSISEIALDCGFWHLSQFATDYKTLFGESPSGTFRRTQTELPRSERRPLRRPMRADSVSSV